MRTTELNSFGHRQGRVRLPMLIGRKETDIQGAGLGFRSRASHMQVVGCTIWIAVCRILWQQNLGNWVGGNGVEVGHAIEHPRSENERVYLGYEHRKWPGSSRPGRETVRDARRSGVVIEQTAIITRTIADERCGLHSLRRLMRWY